MKTNRTVQILLIEDHAATAAMLALVFQELPFRYKLHHRLSAQTVAAEWEKQPYDLVLTDYALPGISGLELIVQLRGQGITVPLILFSAREDPALYSSARLGASAFFPKPFDLEQLLACIQQLVEESTTAPEMPLEHELGR